MNLNFKLLLFGVFLKHRPILKEKLCKYLTSFISRNQKIYLWSQHKKTMFLTEEMYFKAHPPRSDYLLYECILLFSTWLNVQLRVSSIP